MEVERFEVFVSSNEVLYCPLAYIELDALAGCRELDILEVATKATSIVCLSFTE